MGVTDKLLSCKTAVQCFKEVTKYIFIIYQTLSFVVAKIKFMSKLLLFQQQGLLLELRLTKIHNCCPLSSIMWPSWDWDTRKKYFNLGPAIKEEREHFGQLFEKGLKMMGWERRRGRNGLFSSQKQNTTLALIACTLGDVFKRKVMII